MSGSPPHGLWWRIAGQHVDCYRAQSESVCCPDCHKPAAGLRSVIQGKLISFELSLLLVGLPLSFLLLTSSFRLLTYFAVGLCSVAGIFLMFHVDDRYLTIAAPGAILLGSLSAHGLNRLPMPSRFGEHAFASILLVVALVHLATAFASLSDALQRERLDLSAFRQIGEGFRNTVRGRPEEKQQIIIRPDFTLPAALASNPVLLLLPYFAHSSLLLPETDGAYPRDRLFSMPQCPATHAIVPESRVGEGSARGRYFVPQVGQLAVIRLPHSERGGSAPERFCTAKVAR